MKAVIYVLAVSWLAGGCRREERDFAQGGPHDSGLREGQIAQNGPGPLDAVGPQNHLEMNAYALSEGKRLYSSFNCVGCHANGGGDIGPPLMDAKWIYGAAPQQVYASIWDGRPNGMPVFGNRITELEARQLTAYVRSLSGQANSNAATSRDDHMMSSDAENTVKREVPQPDPQPKL